VENFFFNKPQIVVFDLDGTLYEQAKLRKIMLFKLLGYYMLRPWKFSDILILYHFRKEREQRAGVQGPDLNEAQYRWCSDKTGKDLSTVKKVVDKWIFNYPNVYLKECIYPGVIQFLAELKERDIITAVYSDYDAVKKLEYMQLAVDIVVSSTDFNINSFKPSPKGLNYILSTMEITDKSKSLFIGDRDELDGKCAENAGVPFILVDKQSAREDFYLRLLSNLQNIKN